MKPDEGDRQPRLNQTTRPGQLESTGLAASKAGELEYLVS